MKNTILALSMTLLSLNSFASDLAACEKKIAEMLAQVPTQNIQVVSNERIDSYHLSKSSSCGVELAEGKILTISKFKADSFELAKFETIILNGNDPTFTQGRVKAIVSCSMDENSVEYITKVPVLTDGVKSPYAIEKLVITQTEKELYVSLRASLTPIQKVFRSITDCRLSL